MATELWRLPASALGRLLAQREVSAADLLEAALARVERLNPLLNAVVALNDAARAEARASDGRRARGEALGPLDGVPVTIKDNLFARGMRATWGSPLYADFVPDDDELPVARLRGRGCGGARQDQRPRVHDRGLHRQPPVRHHSQPLGPPLDSRRVERRRRRLGRGGPGAARHRHGRRRLDPPARGLCRARRLQALGRAGGPGRRLPAAPARLRGRGTDGAQRRGRGPGLPRDGRSGPPRS